MVLNIKYSVLPQQGSTVNSARSTTTVDSEGDRASRATASRASKFSHSVFQPTSARTETTVDNDDVGFEDFDFNFEPKLSPREDNNHGDYSGKTLVKSQANGQQAAYGGAKGGKTFSKGPAFEFEQVVDPVIPQTLRLPQTMVTTASHDDTEPRSSIYGDNELFVDSESASMQKATKLNSIANNMTSQALSPGTKTSFLGMENSYQNIKHKTPVNQVKESTQCGAPPMGRNLAEEQSRQRSMAATKIQCWYRRHQGRRRASSAAMKRLLQSKRQEKREEMNREQELDRRSEDDRKRMREDKARKARQEAISVSTACLVFKLQVYTLRGVISQIRSTVICLKTCDITASFSESSLIIEQKLFLKTCVYFLSKRNQSVTNLLDLFSRGADCIIS